MRTKVATARRCHLVVVVAAVRDSQTSPVAGVGSVAVGIVEAIAAGMQLVHTSVVWVML